MDLRLDGKVALVTGASKGIGKAIAFALASSGASVMLSSRKAELLEAAAASMTSDDPSVTVAWQAANAGDSDAAARCVEATMDRFGSIDILVNNAATNPYYGPLMGISESQAAKTTQVNQWGLVLWSQLVWRAWMETHGGSIINVASVGGLTVERAIPYYNATKAAVIHLTRHLAVELGPGVRVNAIAPGLVKTDFARALWEDHGDELAATLPLRRLGEPADIAGAAVFLASEAASWITGVILPVDGGLLVTDPPVSGDSLSSA
jgi:NAD(P)-dependent dehydrogenase (short-subunit alcohol dehydrogenase family)